MTYTLVPLYALPLAGRTTLTLRTPDGRVVELLLYDGGGHTRSMGVWRLGRAVLGVVVAGDA